MAFPRSCHVMLREPLNLTRAVCVTMDLELPVRADGFNNAHNWQQWLLISQNLLVAQGPAGRQPSPKTDNEQGQPWTCSVQVTLVAEFVIAMAAWGPDGVNHLPVVYLLSSFASVLLGSQSLRRRGLALLFRPEHTAVSYPQHLEQPNTSCLP